MPYPRPNLSTLIANTQADIVSRLAGTNPGLPFSVLNILAYVFANLQYSQYGYLDYIAQQSIPVTAVDEALSMWAALKGLSLLPASPASGTVQFTGTSGTLVSDGTIVVRPDGYLYAIPDGHGGSIGGGGTFSTTVIATTPGEASNMTESSPLATLQLQVPIAGVSSTVAVTSDFTGGADAETQQSLRSRMIQVYSNPVMGGDLQDYCTWSRNAGLGVTRAWSAGPNIMGAGTATVWFCIDDTNHTNGIPLGTGGTSPDDLRTSIAATEDCLNLANALFPLRPATAFVWVEPPDPVPLNITLAEVPNNATIRANIMTAVQSFCLMNASPGGCILPDLTAGGTVRVSQLEAAISAVPGLDYFEMTSPSVDVTVSTGQLSVPPSAITYT